MLGCLVQNVIFVFFQKLVENHDAYRVKSSITAYYEKLLPQIGLYQDLPRFKIFTAHFYQAVWLLLLANGCYYCQLYPTCQPRNTMQADQNYGLEICLFLLFFIFSKNWYFWKSRKKFFLKYHFREFWKFEKFYFEGFWKRNDVGKKVIRKLYENPTGQKIVFV